MPLIRVNLVEGWTAPVDFTLLTDGATFVLSTGWTVTAAVHDRDNALVDTTADVTILAATKGQVRLTPDTGDFPVAGSPYHLRFKVDDGAGVAFFPDAEPVEITVRH